MKTAVATKERPEQTWDEAADKAAEAILGRWGHHALAEASAFVQPRNVAEALRCELDYLIEHSFHGDASPSNMFESMACYARDALVDLDKMPTVEQIARLLADKQSNYGPGNILAFGVKGIIIRVSDKVNRIENMVANDRDDEVEPLEDAFIDIIGYAVIARMLLDGTFELPLARDVPVQSADEILDEALEQAFASTDHIDVVEALLGDVELAPEIQALLDSVIAMHVEAGRPVPPVVRVYWL